jgi:UDP-galactopyranose mutase
MRYDFLIVGAGISACVLAERLAEELDKKVLVIDSRSHIGGNCYDELDENGIYIHKYGPHIFHTNNKNVWDYLSRFTDWHIYFHRVLAFVEGEFIPAPFNLNSLYKVFTSNFALEIEKSLINKYGYGVKIPILKLLESDDSNLKFLADYVYKNIFLGYNLKQWGLKPEELDPSVSGRVPVYISRDDRYFQDKYQGIPANSYTKMFEKMLAHKNIEVRLNCDFKDVETSVQFDKLIYTGPIDQYFDYSLGELPYRSLRFDWQVKDKELFQSVAQANYPNNFDFTRITEFKHFMDTKTDKTIIALEFPQEYRKGINDPYYPVPNEETDKIFNKYEELARATKNVYFSGRLADYKYYNMDQTVAVALMKFQEIARDI